MVEFRITFRCTHMKLFVKITQFLIALYTIAGAIYSMGNYESLATTEALATLPLHFWIGLGVIQIILAVGLISALFFRPARAQAFSSALCLAGLSLLGTILYSAYAGFPGVLWAVIPAVIFVYIALQK